MTNQIDRRNVLKVGLGGLAGLAATGFATTIASAQTSNSVSFQHVKDMYSTATKEAYKDIYSGKLTNEAVIGRAVEMAGGKDKFVALNEAGRLRYTNRAVTYVLQAGANDYVNAIIAKSAQYISGLGDAEFARGLIQKLDRNPFTANRENFWDAMNADRNKYPRRGAINKTNPLFEDIDSLRREGLLDAHRARQLIVITGNAVLGINTVGPNRDFSGYARQQTVELKEFHKHFMSHLWNSCEATYGAACTSAPPKVDKPTGFDKFEFRI